MKALRFLVVAMFAMFAMNTSIAAQWLKYPTADIPRTADGKPDLAAPAPRQPNGQPVLAGLWRPAPGLVGCIVGGVPRSDFVGYPFKILERPDMVVVMYEAVHSYRQIFTDGRALPKDPNPAWFGYSVGRWEGDVLVVESSGFNDNVWLDNAGRPATEMLKVTERFVRKNFGQMDIEITIDDPKTYTKPWSVTQQLAFQPDTELLEYICNENNKYFEIIPKTER